MLGIASHHTFVDLSSVSKSRLPKKWQPELIDHVTWCSRKTRYRPPHSRPVSAPV
jgi:tRNA A-37 threonylcarbamoyl transferase component Bud32